MLKNYHFFLILFFLTSCAGGWKGFEEAVSGTKKQTTDEYLIKKKDPLILPPDYDKLPLPESKKVKNDNSDIEFILSSEDSSIKNKKSPLEIKIEEELRKKN